jgi:hypothetical protein
LRFEIRNQNLESRWDDDAEGGWRPPLLFCPMRMVIWTAMTDLLVCREVSLLSG